MGRRRSSAKPYLTGYEPMRDAANNVIGIYYVGFMKE